MAISNDIISTWEGDTSSLTQIAAANDYLTAYIGLGVYSGDNPFSSDYTDTFYCKSIVRIYYSLNATNNPTMHPSTSPIVHQSVTSVSPTNEFIKTTDLDINNGNFVQNNKWFSISIVVVVFMLLCFCGFIFCVYIKYKYDKMKLDMDDDGCIKEGGGRRKTDTHMRMTQEGHEIINNNGIETNDNNSFEKKTKNILKVPLLGQNLQDCQNT